MITNKPTRSNSDGGFFRWLFGADEPSRDILYEQELKRQEAVAQALKGPHGSTENLYASVKALLGRAKFPSPETFGMRAVGLALTKSQAAGCATPRYDIGAYMVGAAAQLFVDERLEDLPLLPEDYLFETDPSISPHVGQIRDFLLRLQGKLIHPQRTLTVLTETIAKAFAGIIENLPAVAHEDAAGDPDPDEVPTIAFLGVLPDIERVVAAALEPFQSAEVDELGLFRQLKEALQRNLAEKLPRGDAGQFVHTVLKNTPLEDVFVGPRIPFTLPTDTRFAGHWIIAPPGRGKTTLLHAMVKNDLAADAAIVLMDSKGDLIEPVKQLDCIKDRLLLIEPDPDSAFALNPLDVTHTNVAQAVSLIEYIMAGLLDAKFTALQTTLFRNVVPAIIETMPNPTLDTFKRVMVKGLPTLDKLNPHARQFFENRETGFNSKTYEGTRKEVVWRLDYLLTNPVIRSMFSATHTRLSLSREMDAGKVIIINNSKAILGDEGAEFFGRFFIALIARAAQQRSGKPASSKKPCFVYIDECQTVISKDTRIPVLLDECRSQRIALILAHQRTAQLTAPVLDAVANCAIRMANSDDEARFLSSKLRMETDDLQALSRGTFATFVRDYTPRGIKLQVPKVELGELPKMSEAEFEAVRAHMKSQFSSVPPTRQDTQRSESAYIPSKPELPTKAMPSFSTTAATADATIFSDPGEPADEW